MTTDIIITTILSLLSILLVLTEIFLLPGITVAGIVGAIFSIGSIVYAYMNLGPVGGTITLIVSVSAFAFLFVWLIRSKAIDKIGLTAEINSKVDSEIEKINAGDEGKTVSRLTPIGKVRINDITLEAKSLSGFIDDGKPIIVDKISSNQVLVKIKENT